MHLLSKTSNPRTPVMKRILRDVFKPSVALGKRSREDEEENVAPMGSLPAKDKPNCVALQNEDHDEDAVVITALDTLPFCCHADLLIMSRAELVDTAQTLNFKLPKVLQIDTHDSHSDNRIRRSIEILVGIRSDTPRAPKRNRSFTLNTSDVDASYDQSDTSTILPPSPISPLAFRERCNISSREPLASPGALASLREEEEDSFGSDRPSKRRRTTEPLQHSTPTRAARPMARSHSERVAPVAARDQALLRSRSERLAEPTMGGVHRNITVRARQRQFQSAVLTSTPKARRLVPKSPRTSAAGTVGELSASSPSPPTMEPTFNGSTGLGFDSPEKSMGGDELRGVTSDFNELSVGSSSSLSDMDISK